MICVEQGQLEHVKCAVQWALTCCVCQGVIGDVWVLVKEHAQLTAAAQHTQHTLVLEKNSAVQHVEEHTELDDTGAISQVLLPCVAQDASEAWRTVQIRRWRASLPDAQVVFIELVRYVEADGPKLAPLLQHAVEEGQAQQQQPEGRIMHAALQEVTGAEGVARVRAQQACNSR
jgi:hypothetical protein